MRALIPLLFVTLTLSPVLLAAPAPASAQEVGDTLTVRGCLALDDDDATEFLLTQVTGALAAFGEIELIPAEGVALSGHVGHSVEVTGVVVADDDEDEEVEEVVEQEEPGVETELHVRVTELGHLAASCGGG